MYYLNSAPNETVEKPILGRAFPVQGLTERPVSRVVGSLRFFSLRQGLDQRPKGVDLADIVNQSEQSPLYIHFPLRAQSEAMHALLHTDVGKDRLNDAQPSGIDRLPSSLSILAFIYRSGWVAGYPLERKDTCVMR